MLTIDELRSRANIIGPDGTGPSGLKTGASSGAFAYVGKPKPPFNSEARLLLDTVRKGVVSDARRSLGWFLSRAGVVTVSGETGGA
jgi:hypothetical protein